MSDPREPKDRLREELAALGEAPPEEQELQAAARLAAALDAPGDATGVAHAEATGDTHAEATGEATGLREPGAAEDDLADLARIIRASANTPPQAEASPGAVDATDRVLGSLMPDAGDAPGEPSDLTARDETQRDDTQRDDTQRDDTQRDDTQRDDTQRDDAQRDDTQRDEVEQKEASLLGDQVDRALAGLPPPDILPREISAALVWTTQIRARLHAETLSPARLESILDDAFATASSSPAPATSPEPAPGSRRRDRSRRVLTAVTVATVLAASVAGIVLWSTPRRGPTASPPPALLSRSTRDVLPRAFPPTQSPTDRIDLIYQDRLQAYRALQLGAWPRWRSRPARRRRPPRATPALAGVLAQGGP